MSLSLIIDIHSGISLEEGWQGHHTYVNMRDFSTRQTTSELGNDHHQREIKETKTKHEVMDMYDIGIKVVERNFAFIPEQVPRYSIGTEVNNVAMGISDPFKYLKEIHTQVAKFNVQIIMGHVV